ncbi:MAG TPA: hypothetical protein VLF43_04265 [Candidatus Saccharimonadales bacterium]|nr:hypothetical protein [Candidatus Saccharimonadales bacterium]
MTEWQQHNLEAFEPERQDLRIVFGLAEVALYAEHAEARVPYLTSSYRNRLDDQTAITENDIRKKLTLAALQDPQGIRRPPGEVFWTRQLIRESMPEIAQNESRLTAVQTSLDVWLNGRFRVARKRVLVPEAVPVNNRGATRGFFKVSEKFNITDIVVEKEAL